MIQRRLFFLFEKLKITPAERRTMAVLLAVLLLLSSARLLVSPPEPYGGDYYREADARFQALSAAPDDGGGGMVPPAVLSAPDTVEADSLATPPDSLDDARLNINTADAGALQALPGIGPVYASRIVAWREQFGPFQGVEELLLIRGIGEKRLEKIKPFIKLKDDRTNQAP